jgi:hypothetical protein
MKVYKCAVCGFETDDPAACCTKQDGSYWHDHCAVGHGYMFEYDKNLWKTLDMVAPLSVRVKSLESAAWELRIAVILCGLGLISLAVLR